MAEIGLIAYSKVALEIARSAMPAYRSKFSKRQFTEPQLLAILGMMRYEDWTFREAEVCLADHRELHPVPGLKDVSDYTPRCIVSRDGCKRH